MRYAFGRKFLNSILQQRDMTMLTFQFSYSSRPPPQGFHSSGLTHFIHSFRSFIQSSSFTWILSVRPGECLLFTIKYFMHLWHYITTKEDAIWDNDQYNASCKSVLRRAHSAAHIMGSMKRVSLHGKTSISLNDFQNVIPIVFAK